MHEEEHDDGIDDVIVEMIRDVLRDDSLAIDRATPIETLGIDSLDFVELVFKMEERFNVDIAFNSNTDGSFPFATVGDAANEVRLLIAQKSAFA